MLRGIVIIIVMWNNILYNGTVLKGRTLYEFNWEIYTNFKLS